VRCGDKSDTGGWVISRPPLRPYKVTVALGGKAQVPPRSRSSRELCFWRNLTLNALIRT
jgi:hypothetical protein